MRQKTFISHGSGGYNGLCRFCPQACKAALHEVNDSVLIDGIKQESIPMDHFDCKHPEIKNRLVAENGYAFSFLNKMPITPGHTLICPKRPVIYSHKLSKEEWRDILSLKTEVCRLLKEGLGAQGFNFAWNEELVAGQTVAHFHLHVVPRKTGDSGIIEYEPRVFLYRPGTRADSPQEELISLAKELRNLGN